MQQQTFIQYSVFSHADEGLHRHLCIYFIIILLSTIFSFNFRWDLFSIHIIRVLQLCFRVRAYTTVKFTLFWKYNFYSNIHGMNRDKKSHDCNQQCSRGIQNKRLHTPFLLLLWLMSGPQRHSCSDSEYHQWPYHKNASASTALLLPIDIIQKKTSMLCNTNQILTPRIFFLSYMVLKKLKSFTLCSYQYVLLKVRVRDSYVWRLTGYCDDGVAFLLAKFSLSVQ